MAAIKRAAFFSKFPSNRRNLIFASFQPTRSRLQFNLHHRFSTETAAKPNTTKHRRHPVVLAAAVTLASATGISLYTRHIRKEKLSTLTPAKDSGLLSASAPISVSKTQPPNKAPKYHLPTLIETITRAGLVGSEKSVKQELDHLRKWHLERGYNGGLIVRDVTQPLFMLNLFDFGLGHHSNGNDQHTIEADENELGSGAKNNKQQNDDSNKDIHPNQRECYYLYYEIHPNGRTNQQLFCRGTTLLADVWTCLQTWFVYDEELGCRVHYGFKKHADRILEDVIPLLVPPPLPPVAKGPTTSVASHARNGGVSHATIELCGHSLGGAVATIVAIKLRKRGYVVTKVTSLGGPRFCRGIEEREILEKWLPKETIRIDDDLDIVTYLPPVGVSVGDKLWFVCEKSSKRESYMLPIDWIQDLSSEHSWVESVWINLRLFESLWNQSETHRVRSYVKKLEQLLKDIESGS